MTCRQCQFLIGTEEEGARAANAQLQAHLKTCADCTQFAGEMWGLSEVLAEVTPLRAPSGFASRVRADVRAAARDCACSPCCNS